MFSSGAYSQTSVIWLPRSLSLLSFHFILQQALHPYPPPHVANSVRSCSLTSGASNPLLCTL